MKRYTILSIKMLLLPLFLLHINTGHAQDSTIRNQLSSAQDANFWISGRGLIGTTQDKYPNYNLQVFGKTWLDNFVHLDFGANFANRGVVMDGNTMGGYVPLHINGNDDGIGMEMEDGLFKFIRSNDLYENENYSGGSSTFVTRYPYGAVPFMQRNGHDYTILALQSPPAALNAYETTLALINGDNSEEYVDLYNLSYPSSKKFGFRMQKRATGSYKPFFFEYSDGSTTYPVVQITPDTSAYFYGKVGIGTTAPQEKLSVNGNVRAREIKVEAANWPDYVFKPSYKLMPLAQVETFFKQNGHLPEVPSAKEVAEKGVEVGANQAVLLKKIEELTLHLIELEKENNKLKENIQVINAHLKIKNNR